MDEEVIKGKIERSLELICPLYKDSLITDAYIIGSVATGTARKESDIDIIIINPDFIMDAADLPPFLPLPIGEDINSLSEKEKRRESLRKQIVKKLNDIGVEFKLIYRKEDFLWYQLYKGDIFHLLPFNEKFYIENLPHIRMMIDLCR